MEDRKMFGTSPGVEEKVYKNPIPSEIVDAARRNVQRMWSGGGVEQQVGTGFTGYATRGCRCVVIGGGAVGADEDTSEQLVWSESRDPLKLQEIWSEFFAVPNGKLFTDVQKKHTPCGWFVMIPYTVLGSLICFLTGCCCGYGCKWDRKRVLAWDAALRQWQNEFSEKLRPYGLFVKTKSFYFVIAGEQRSLHFTRWLAIALSAEESRKLAQEPHLSGDIDHSCEICGGVNEHELCAHPPCRMTFA
eukprot:g7097.t1